VGGWWVAGWMNWKYSQLSPAYAGTRAEFDNNLLLPMGHKSKKKRAQKL